MPSIITGSLMQATRRRHNGCRRAHARAPSPRSPRPRPPGPARRCDVHDDAAFSISAGPQRRGRTGLVVGTGEEGAWLGHNSLPTEPGVDRSRETTPNRSVVRDPTFAWISHTRLGSAAREQGSELVEDRRSSQGWATVAATTQDRSRRHPRSPAPSTGAVAGGPPVARSRSLGCSSRSQARRVAVIAPQPGQIGVHRPLVAGRRPGSYRRRRRCRGTGREADHDGAVPGRAVLDASQQVGGDAFEAPRRSASRPDRGSPPARHGPRTPRPTLASTPSITQARGR